MTDDDRFDKLLYVCGVCLAGSVKRVIWSEQTMVVAGCCISLIVWSDSLFGWVLPKASGLYSCMPGQESVLLYRGLTEWLIHFKQSTCI